MTRTNTSQIVGHILIAIACHDVTSAAESSVKSSTITKAERRLERIDTSQTSLEHAIDQLDVKLKKAWVVEADGYGKLVALQNQATELIKVTGSLPDEYEKVVKASKNLESVLSGAADDFRAAASQWRKFAAEERVESGIAEIIDDYLVTAKIWDTCADAVDAQSKKPLSFAEL